MTAPDVFAQFPMQVEEDGDLDAALGALIHLYLRSTYDPESGCWPGRDEHDTLRRTCHAVEVLYRLNLDSDTDAMVRAGGNWLINLPGSDELPSAERERLRRYPSRFKTLAYLRRFDDELLYRDFDELLKLEIGGMIRGVTESDVLTTCIALDTLVTLDRTGQHYEVRGDERYSRMIVALRRQLARWRPEAAPSALRSTRRGTAPHGTTPPRRAAATGGEIRYLRDLSYVLGLLLHADRPNLPPRQVLSVVDGLTAALNSLERGADLSQVLYAALQLAEHYRADDGIQTGLAKLFEWLHGAYARPETPRRWDLLYHTLVLRLLLTHHGDDAFTRRVVARYLHEAERRREAEQSTLQTELAAVLRERIEVRFGEIAELSGGYTDDRVYRVPFRYWYAMPDPDAGRSAAYGQLEASVIIKRSTSDAFHTATRNYQELPITLHRFFVRQPPASQAQRAGSEAVYYLTMEDLADLDTFERRINEFDRRAMSDTHARLLRAAAASISEAVFTLFRETQRGPSDFPGSQVARLYLAVIDGKLPRAIQRAPWLKTPLEGLSVGEQRYRPFEHYLAVLSRHMSDLAPRALGLTHGDLHPRNIMLDRSCTRLKLIDLDKLSWLGDYVADLGNLLADVCIFRRLAAPEREFGLSRAQIAFTHNAEGTLGYPMLGRPATILLQQHIMEATANFAATLDDRTWRPRLWLAAVTALITRLTFVSENAVAAVLYAEAARLLHELTRFLDAGAALPETLVPEPRLARAVTGSGDLPDWAAAHASLRALHEGLRELGLHPVADRGVVSYAAPLRERVVARLVPPRPLEGIARLLLPSAAAELGAEGVKVVRSAQDRDAFGTIVVVEPQTDVPAALRLVHQALVLDGVRIR
jgi:hypothetical protein